MAHSLVRPASSLRSSSVPPTAYGGTERVVSWLVEELVRRGHDVTLFASSDSRTKARLADGSARAPPLRRQGHLPPSPRSRARSSGRTSSLHANLDFSLPSRAWNARRPTSGRLDLPKATSSGAFRKDHVSISDAQRAAARSGSCDRLRDARNLFTSTRNRTCLPRPDLAGRGGPRDRGRGGGRRSNRRQGGLADRAFYERSETAPPLRVESSAKSTTRGSRSSSAVRARYSRSMAGARACSSRPRAGHP